VAEVLRASALPALLLWLVAGIARAAGLAVGDTLPPLRVEDLGELQIEGESIRYAPWQSDALTGKVQVVQYMAARLSAKSVNEPFTDRLRDSGIPFDRYHMTTIVNLDDALFGTRGMVMGELEKNKKRYFRSSIVADARGLGLKAWGLASGTSAIILLGTDGRVHFFREGSMTQDEIAGALEFVRDGGKAAVALR